MGEVRITIKDVESDGTRGVVFAVARSGDRGPAHTVADLVVDNLKSMMDALSDRGAAECVAQTGIVSDDPEEATALFRQKAAEIARVRAAGTN